MKKLLSLFLLAGMLVSFTACTDETLNPLPGWDYSVHGYNIFDGIAFNGVKTARPQPYERDYSKNFSVTGQDASKVPFKIRWVSLDNKLTVNKIEIYVRMLEYYNDPEGNPKTADLSGNGKGKLYTTLTPAGNRQWTSYTIDANKVYELYKNATVKYNKVTAVPVFSNPSRPRPAGAYFRVGETAKYGDVAADDFVVTWKLYTADGKVFDTFNPDSICGDPTPVSEANSNCQSVFGVR